MQRTLTIAFISLSLIACSEEPPVPEPEARPAKMMTVSIGDGDINRTFSGTVEADDQAVLAFRVSGEITDMPALAGIDVVAGDVLAELDKDEYGLLLAKAKASYRLSKVQYDRAVKLKKTNVISEQDFDSAKSSLSEAKAGLDLAQSNFDYTTLKAPYSGTISLRVKERNEFVGAMEPVMHIQTKDVINVSFQLPERLFQYFNSESELQSHQPLISFDTYPGSSFPATLKEVDTEADTTTASYRITVTLPRPDNVNVLPGMAAQVTATLPGASQNIIPDTAIENDGDSTLVWRVGEDGKVSKVSVSLENNKLVGGLESGDTIVINGINSLDEGMVVYPWVKERGL
ncbi:efflux RND transporter periplasmic adaptor subunit [Enterovibrio norvegicus]|uniref:Efflux transporter periplasmic adaptor subunit n=1 Tax=Enterovibrio norvegicus TaxID=188144 RepID=A0A2N7LH90_9GAMM|nr:efflux RND transporter periplasmic adaptor subunit [Enterovibrio norvegicus]PMN62089.1 efflux transporter periplasmic adaptor subunit [Enterovibrio norvegicus]PMN94922.1 efflux transporter periplasmic adaptor subunit [Enterovibrio norvegicus]